MFSRLKKENPSYREKVSCIRGDIQLPNLNLSAEDELRLVNEVNIIFHAAATVNFHQKLRVAVEINMHGIRKVMELGKKMYNLKVSVRRSPGFEPATLKNINRYRIGFQALIHISTVYSNCHLKKIEEKVYDFHVSYDEILYLMKTYPDDEIDKIASDLVGDGNNYTFTKALAERYIQKNCENLPIAIFRPAIGT